MIWVHNPRVQRFRAGGGRVFIYKALEERLSLHNGFFKIVVGSQCISLEEIRNAQARDIHCQPGQATILDGDLVMEYPQAGSGVGLLKCLWKAAESTYNGITIIYYQQKELQLDPVYAFYLNSQVSGTRGGTIAEKSAPIISIIN